MEIKGTYRIKCSIDTDQVSMNQKIIRDIYQKQDVATAKFLNLFFRRWKLISLLHFDVSPS